MVSKSKVDLFVFLERLSKVDIKYLHSLTDDEKKSLAPLIIHRWLSGTKDKKQIQYLNNFVNPLIFNMYRHPNLLFKLMMASCTGSTKRYKWIKNKSNKHNSIQIDIIMKYYSCGSREANEYYALLSQNDIVEMANLLGEDEKIIEKLKKE